MALPLRMAKLKFALNDFKETRQDLIPFFLLIKKPGFLETAGKMSQILV